MAAPLVGAQRRAEQRQRLAAHQRLRQPHDLRARRRPFHLLAVATGVLLPRDRRLPLSVDGIEQRRRRTELLPPRIPRLFRFRQRSGSIACDEQPKALFRARRIIPTARLYYRIIVL